MGHGRWQLSLREERNQVGLYVNGGSRGSEVSNMDMDMWTKSEKDKIQNIDLVWSGRNRFGFAKNKCHSNGPKSFAFGGAMVKIMK